MEGYTNIGGSHFDFNDLDIEGRNSDELKQDKTKRSSDAKKEETGSEERKRLLEIKVKVDDGNYGYVFSVQRRDSDWRWRCHLCDVVIVGQVHVETHIQSKKHQVKMGVLVHERDLFSRFEGEPAAWEAVEVEPGEPIPPGMEGAVLQKRGVAQIQAILDCHRSSPLIGLEYLVELVPDERDAEPMYVCTLCDKKGDPRVAMAHLSSFNHRSKYIGINFPMANRAVNNAMPKTKAGRKGVADIVTRICAKIEEKHGRLKPLVLQQEEYNAKKNEYHKQIENEQHFRETPDENYMDIVEQDAILPNSVNVDDVPLPVKEAPKPEEVRRKITVDRSRLRTHASRDEGKSSQDENKGDTGKNKRAGRRSSLSSVSSSSLSRSPSPPRSRSKSRTKSSSPSAFRRRPRSRSPRERFRAATTRRRCSRSRSPRYPRRRSRSRSHSRYRNASFGRRSPHKDKSIVNAPLTEKEKWTRFRAECDKVERTLNKTLKFHEKNPEKHPMYPEEWKKFWNVRYKELQADGKDPSKHDFKPEWIEFWNKRMREMHNDEFNLKKEELRTKFDLPKEEQPVTVLFPRIPRPPELDNDVIVISPTPMSSVDVSASRSWKRQEERKRSLSPWDKDDVSVHKSSRTKWAPPSRYEDSRRKEPHEDTRRKDSYEDSRRKESYEDTRRKESYEDTRRKESYDDTRRKESYEESRRKDQYADSKRKDAYEDSRRKDFEESLRRKDYEESSRRKEYEESKRRKDYEDVPRRKDPYGDDPPPRRKEYGSPSHLPGHIRELEPCGEETRVVTVIRLLTAMESQLGSMGPAVNNLLASALAMEKTRPGASESLLGNPDNLVLFETVKEKLKGQLFAGIVEPGLVMATRACIQNLANMLFRAEEMLRVARAAPAPPPVVSVPKPAPVVTVPGVGAMDKAAIATQIAAALVAEGRGNVTQAELESLINAVVGMAQASVAMDKPITAAAFVQQMQPPPPEQKSPLEKLLSVVQQKPVIAPEPVAKCLFPSAVVVEPPVREPTPPAPPRMNLVDMEELTESDLKALLQNFKDLSTEEQYCLITYLKKIEAKEPDRVENLRQFVNLAPLKPPVKPAAASSGTERGSGRLSPFSLRMGQANPSVDESFKKKQHDDADADTAPKLKLDDSDDDYSFDDIYAAASKKVNEKEQEAKELIRKATDEAANQQLATKTKEDEANNILRETKLMIANLMGHLPTKFAQKRLTPSPGPVKASTPTAAATTTATLVDVASRPNMGLNIDISNTLTDAAALDMFCNPIPKPVSAPIMMVPSPLVTTMGKPSLSANQLQTVAGLTTTTAPSTTLYEGVDQSYVNNVFNNSYLMQNANYNGSYGQQSFAGGQASMVAYPNQQYANQSYSTDSNFMAGNSNSGFYLESGVQQDNRYPLPARPAHTSFPNQQIPNQFRPQGYPNCDTYPNQQAYMDQYPSQQQRFY